MQTDREFLDNLDICQSDEFLVLAVRRAAASQLGLTVHELETTTIGLPEFFLPWDGKQFGFLLEKEIGIAIPFSEKRFTESLTSIQEEHPEWFCGPAVKMRMGEWTEIAVRQFLGPIIM